MADPELGCRALFVREHVDSLPRRRFSRHFCVSPLPRRRRRYNERFVFEFSSLEEMRRSALAVRVMDYDLLSGDDTMGVHSQELSTLRPGAAPITQQLRLDSRLKGQDGGVLFVQLGCVKGSQAVEAAKRAAMSAAADPAAVVGVAFHVVRAAGLPVADRAASDPYVVVQCGDQKMRTATKRASRARRSASQWDEKWRHSRTDMTSTW